MFVLLRRVLADQYEVSTIHSSLFSGRRMCLGEQLAKQEVFLFFAHLVQKFHFYSSPEWSLPPPEGTYAITHKCPPYKIIAKLRI